MDKIQISCAPFALLRRIVVGRAEALHCNRIVITDYGCLTFHRVPAIQVIYSTGHLTGRSRCTVLLVQGYHSNRYYGYTAPLYIPLYMLCFSVRVASYQLLGY